VTIWYVDMSDEELAKETAKDRSIWLDKKELRGEKEKTMGKVKEVMLGVVEDVVAYYDSDKNEWADNFDNILKEVTDKYGSWIQDVAIATYQKIERQRKLIHEDN
jgi:hypothetical protein